MLYWRGLLDAARSNFGRFNAQDLANCISAGEQRGVGWFPQDSAC